MASFGSYTIRAILRSWSTLVFVSRRTVPWDSNRYILVWKMDRSIRRLPNRERPWRIDCEKDDRTDFAVPQS